MHKTMLATDSVFLINNTFSRMNKLLTPNVYYCCPETLHRNVCDLKIDCFTTQFSINET